MAKVSDSFYFDNFVACSEFAVQAAELLNKTIKNFDPATIKNVQEDMHNIEESADKKRHEMTDVLITAFITPIEREDIDLLSSALDTVVDRIEGVAHRLYFTNVQAIRPDAVEMSDKIVEATKELNQLLVDLPRFKRSKEFREHVVKINDIEEENDKLYIEAMHTLHATSKDPLEVIAWRDVYSFLEHCADSVEAVADVASSVVMKNS